MQTSLLLAAAAISTLSLLPGDGDWPSFRGPGARGVAPGAHPPASWSLDPPENVRWRRALPGLAHSSPIVAGERIYVATAVPSQDAPFELAEGGAAVTKDAGQVTWGLVALERASGALAWKHEIVEDVPSTARHEKSSLCNATPASDGRLIATIFGSKLHVLGTDGEPRWSHDLGLLDGGYVGHPEYQWGHGSSPVIHDGLVIVQIDGATQSYLAAFRAESGELAWRVERGDLPTWSTPTVHAGAERVELITNGGHYARSYDLRTGAELWRYADRAEVKVPTPFVAGDLVYLAGGSPRGRSMLALRLGASGDLSPQEGEPSSEHLAWRVASGGPYTVTPIVVDGRFFTCTDDGTLGCYDADTGERLWRERLGEDFSASPVAADGRLYLASEGGDVLVVSTGPQYELLARNAMGAPCMATPALSRDLLLVRTTGELVALGA